jgi:hypothetical protein
MDPDLRVAEAYSMRVFDMEIIGGEAMLNDGLWYTLPFDKAWDDAVAGVLIWTWSPSEKGELG